GVSARIKKKPRSDLSPRRRARSASAIARSRKSGVGQQPKIFLTNTTPSAPSRRLRDIFIDDSATRPQLTRLRRGVFAKKFSLYRERSYPRRACAKPQTIGPVAIAGGSRGLVVAGPDRRSRLLFENGEGLRSGGSFSRAP